MVTLHIWRAIIVLLRLHLVFVASAKISQEVDQSTSIKTDSTNPINSRSLHIQPKPVPVCVDCRRTFFLSEPCGRNVVLPCPLWTPARSLHNWITLYLATFTLSENNTLALIHRRNHNTIRIGCTRKSLPGVAVYLLKLPSTPLFDVAMCLGYLLLSVLIELNKAFNLNALNTTSVGPLGIRC